MVSGSKPVPQTEAPDAAFAWLAQADKQPICVMLDLCGHLRSEKTLRGLRNLIQQFEQTGALLVLIEHASEVPAVVAAYATSFDLSLPDEKELEAMVLQTLRLLNEERPVEIDIKRSALNAIVRNLRGLSRRQVETIIDEVVCVDHRFDDADINAVVAAKRRMVCRDGLLEYVESPVDLAEIGGLARLKSWLHKRRAAGERKAVEFGLTPPRGVLMLGVQGAGKSLSAKAIATAWQRPLLRLDVGALYDRYVGESERRLRDSLAQAEAMSPIVLWIDEVEKAFASSASRSTDGGLSQRMFATLLTWMQEKRSDVFLVATANDIEALPPELLRKGRFDEIFFVDLPSAAARRDIVAIHLRKRRRDPAKFDLDALAQASHGFSGAEIEQAILAALHDAFESDRDIDTECVISAMKNSPPLSVTMAERVAELRDWALGRCTPAE